MIKLNLITLRKSIDKANLEFKPVRDELERFKNEFKKFHSLTNAGKIDKMVYKLYGLTEDEIKIVED